METLSFSQLFPIKGGDLRSMRMMGGLTTMQMAAAAGVKTRKTYENWEKNLGTPNVNQFFDMVRACGFDLDNLDFFQSMKAHRQRLARHICGPNGKPNKSINQLNSSKKKQSDNTQP